MQELLGFPGNASSIHKAGREARKRIEDARAQIIKLVNAGPRDIVVFTSGATEANNLALRVTNIERVIASAIEHPSVLQAAPHAQIIPALPTGIIDLAALDKMLEGNTQQTLISVMTLPRASAVSKP